MSANHSPSNGVDAVDKETAINEEQKPTAEHMEDTMVELRENYVKAGKKLMATSQRCCV